jgi:hypothetical protein
MKYATAMSNSAIPSCADLLSQIKELRVKHAFVPPQAMNPGPSPEEQQMMAAQQQQMMAAQQGGQAGPQGQPAPQGAPAAGADPMMEMMSALEQMGMMLDQTMQQNEQLNQTIQGMKQETSQTIENMKQRIETYEAQMGKLSGQTELLIKTLGMPPAPRTV